MASRRNKEAETRERRTTMKTLITLTLMLLMLPVAAQGDICVPGDTVTVTWTKATDSPPPNYTGPLPLPVRYKVFIGTNDIDRVEAGAYVTDLSFTFRPQEGIWQVWVMAEDYCGNSIFSLPSEVFKLDKTAPVWDSQAPPIVIPVPTP